MAVFKPDERVARARRKQILEAKSAAAIEDQSKRSWSAAHPAYFGTSLCSDPKYKKKQEGK